MNMFSVVIPLYNKERNILKTLMSILNQSYKEFEVVIVNDGSTDNSVKIIETIKDPRIRLIDQNNQGVSAARNRGILESRYEWIAFLDGDDLWEENHLIEFVKMLELYPKSKVLATSFRYSDNRIKSEPNSSDSIYYLEDYFKIAAKSSVIWTGCICVHKTCFNSVGLFNVNLNRGEDLDLWARLAKKFYILKSVLVTSIYVVDSDNKLTTGLSNYNKSLVSIIDLKNSRGTERSYYKNILFRRIKHNLLRFRIGELIKILYKHNFQLFF